MRQKGRQKIVVPLGEKSRSAKLTKHKAQEIYKSKLPSKELAQNYGVTRQSIESIRSGLTWFHATGAVYAKEPSK